MMYNLHYNYVKAKYGDNAKLLFTDTDSLAYEIMTKVFTNHPSGIKAGHNGDVIVMFKDEAGGTQIVEFLGMRAKLYFYKMLHVSHDSKCNGVSKNVRKSVFNSMTIESGCLAGRNNIEKWMSNERSHCHEIFTEEINKITHSSDDDKRVIMADGIPTLAYGHTNLTEIVIKKWVTMKYQIF